MSHHDSDGITEKPSALFSETSSTHTRRPEHDSDAKPFIPIAIADCQRCTRYPANCWSRIREYIREPAAEFLGTMILVIFGCGGNCQVVLSSNPTVSSSHKGEYLSLNLGWAIGVAMGVWACGGISGGHINPAFTLAMASVRKFPWKKVPFYIMGQMLGGICGAGVVYANYYHAINLYEGGADIRTIYGTGDLFGAYPAPYMTNVACFFDQFLGAAMLVVAILSVTDKRNGPPPAGLVPLALFFATLGIGLGFGMQTSFAINPARDLGPRILTSLVGYGKAVYDFRNQYWFWCTLLGPIFGMHFGAFAYDALIYTGSESFVNKPDKEAEERHLDCCAQHKKAACASDVV